MQDLGKISVGNFAAHIGFTVKLPQTYYLMQIVFAKNYNKVLEILRIFITIKAHLKFQNKLLPHQWSQILNS